MRKILVLLSIIAFNKVYSQNFKEKSLKTEIKEVTVFTSGAQIFESGEVEIPQGHYKLIVSNLSPFLNKNSIQVKTEGHFTVLSVNHRLNHLNEIKLSNQLDSLAEIADKLNTSLLKDLARQDVLKEKSSLLNSNKNINSQNTGNSIAQLKQALELFDLELTKIKDEEIVLSLSVRSKNEQIRIVNKQLKELSDQRMPIPTSEIEIRVYTDGKVNGKIQLTYLVANAGWFPKYDVRVESIQKPLSLTYKAEVYQNTGKDWNNVKLRFSNGDPTQNGTIPVLSKWNLNYARNTNFISQRGASVGEIFGIVTDIQGQPIPGVVVRAKGTQVGVTSDGNGKYTILLPSEASVLTFSMVGMKTVEHNANRPEVNVKMEDDSSLLEEIVVSGLSGKTSGVRAEKSRIESPPVITNVIENQTTVEIEVELPYTIKSNSDKLIVDLQKHSINAEYEYFAVPKLDKDAFLITKVSNWEQYNLIEGEANLYFEDAFIGRTLLNANSIKDILEISLGRDKNVLVSRVKNEQFKKIKSIGSNQIESRGYTLTVRNKKNSPITLTLIDQVPVAVISDISVNITELSQGNLDSQTGKVTWDVIVPAQKQKEVNLQYEVKYPKREKVVLD